METKEEFGEAPCAAVGGKWEKWEREEVEEPPGQEFPSLSSKVARGEVGGRVLHMPFTRQGDKRTFRCLFETWLFCILFTKFNFLL